MTNYPTNNRTMIELIDLVNEDLMDENIKDEKLAQNIICDILRVIGNVNIKELNELIDIAYNA